MEKPSERRKFRDIKENKRYAGLRCHPRLFPGVDFIRGFLYCHMSLIYNIIQNLIS